MKQKKKHTTHKDIARRIRAQRLKAKFTREQLSALLAISLKDYVDMEEGARGLTENFVEDFSNLYNMPVDFFSAEETVRDLINDF